MAILDLFWRHITTAVVKEGNRVQRHRAPSDGDYVRPIPIGRRYPGLDSAPAFLSENTPQSEAIGTFSHVALHEVLTWKESYSLRDGFPDPWTGESFPYPREYESLAPTPKHPEDFAPGGDRLAGVARRGAFSLYLQPDGDEGRYKLDMSALEGLEPRAPFVPVGGVAHFERVGDALRTTSIEFQGETLRAGDTSPEGAKTWALAEKRILVALNTYCTFVDHLTHVHILGGGTWTICTHLALPARHPLRILLQPFVVETMRVNNDNIDGLIKSEHSNVPCYSGYPLGTLNAVMRDAIERFDVRWFDPEHRAREAGMVDPMFPTMQSALTLWSMFKELADAWCEQHLPTVDLETRIWCQELNARVPNGVGKLIGVEDFENGLEVEHVAHLAAVGMFTASVWHHIVANMTRDYMLSFDAMPPAMDADGHPTLGIAYEKRNSITIAGLFRYRLVDDTVYLPEDSMKALWERFQSQLKDYESSLADDPARAYRIVPSEVPSSVHA